MSEFPQPIEYDALPDAFMDYSTMSVMSRVMSESITGARVRMVVGTDSGDVVIAFDVFSENREEGKPGFDRWLFSADPKLFRLHPCFDLVQRKTVKSHIVEVLDYHITGARVDGIEQVKFERVVMIDFTRRELTGEEVSYRFVVELMGKYSNLILVDSEGVILASWKSVHSYQSRYREVRAGKKYKLPPKQDRIEPREFSPDEWNDFIGSAGSDTPLDRHLSGKFHGMSNNWAHAVCLTADVNPEMAVAKLDAGEIERLKGAFEGSVERVLNGEPLTGDDPVDFVKRVTADFSERVEDEQVNRLRSRIHGVIEKRRKKLSSLKMGLQSDLEKAEKAEEYKKQADLLLANMHLATTGAPSMVVHDWEKDEDMILRMDPSISPPMQVERWYNRYRKLKRTEEVALERTQAVRAELEEILALEEELASVASFDEIHEVEEKAVLRGLIPPVTIDETEKARRGKKNRQKVTDGSVVKISSVRYRSNDGYLITAGTNNVSNDALRRIARKEDIWLHVRDIPGSHVYITTRGQKVPETTLREAAMVAAWHSKAREGSNIPVDYTFAKYITPIPGATIGKVRFQRERTIRVTPDEKRIEMMRMMAGGDDFSRI